MRAGTQKPLDAKCMCQASACVKQEEIARHKQSQPGPGECPALGTLGTLSAQHCSIAQQASLLPLGTLSHQSHATLGHRTVQPACLNSTIMEACTPSQARKLYIAEEGCWIPSWAYPMAVPPPARTSSATVAKDSSSPCGTPYLHRVHIHAWLSISPPADSAFPALVLL